MAVIDVRQDNPESPDPALRALELHFAVRGAVAEIIDHPSAAGVRAVVVAAQRMMRFETESWMPRIDPVRRTALEQSHQELAAHLNVLCWHGPGSKEMSAAVVEFRRVLLAHLGLINRR